MLPHLVIYCILLTGNFGSLYDVSVAYHHTIPQDELAILKGEFPQEVHFHIKRIPNNELPESETGMCEGSEIQMLDLTAPCIVL